VVKYLVEKECVLEESTIPKCYHFCPHQDYIRSPKIPVIIEGVRVPMILDTGDEVSLITTKFPQNLFPDRDLSTTLPLVQFAILGAILLSSEAPSNLKSRFVMSLSNTHSTFMTNQSFFSVLILSHVQL